MDELVAQIKWQWMPGLVRLAVNFPRASFELALTPEEAAKILNAGTEAVLEAKAMETEAQRN